MKSKHMLWDLWYRGRENLFLTREYTSDFKSKSKDHPEKVTQKGKYSTMISLLVKFSYVQTRHTT